MGEREGGILNSQFSSVSTEGGKSIALNLGISTHSDTTHITVTHHISQYAKHI